MVFALLCLAIVEPTPISGAPIAWSPDGRWVAHVQATRPAAGIIETGWLLRDEPRPAPSRQVEVDTYRLWATKIDTGESVKLAESADPLSSPCWHPDGISIAYQRIATDAPGRSRLELVVQDGTETRKTLWSHPLELPLRNPSSRSTPLAAPAWSLDGRYLAVPEPGSPSIAIIRVADGVLMKTIEGGFGPAWSDDGKLAFFRRGTPDSVSWIDAHFSGPRRLADAPNASKGPAPFWSRDGVTLSFVRRGPLPPRAPVPGIPPAEATDPVVQLARIRTDTGVVEASYKLLWDPASSMDAIGEISVAIGRDVGEIYATMAIRDVPSQLITLRPRPNDLELLAKSHPIDYTLPIGILSASPSSRRLAIRLGPDGARGLPGVCEPDGSGFVAIAPDESARIEWVTALVGLARELLAVTASLAEPTTGRPSLVPLPDAANPDETVTMRLRRIAEIGRSLCDRTYESPPEPPTRAFLVEARLFFCLLLADYQAALSEIPAFTLAAETTDSRARLLGLRAQIDFGLGNVDKAKAAAEYLRSTTPRAASRIEETPAGLVLTPLPGPSGWINALSVAVSAKPAKAAKPSEMSPAIEPPDDPPPPRTRVRRPTPPPVPRPEQDQPALEPVPIP